MNKFKFYNTPDNDCAGGQRTPPAVSYRPPSLQQPQIDHDRTYHEDAKNWSVSMASRSCLRGLLPLHHRATAICSAKTRKIPRPIQNRETRREISKSELKSAPITPLRFLFQVYDYVIHIEISAYLIGKRRFIVGLWLKRAVVDI